MMGPIVDASTALEMLGFMGPEVKEGSARTSRSANPSSIPTLPFEERAMRGLASRTSSSPAAAGRSRRDLPALADYAPQ